MYLILFPMFFNILLYFINAKTDTRHACMLNHFSCVWLFVTYEM